MDDPLLARVMDDIYAAALAPARLPAMLGGLARLFRSHFADSYGRSDDYLRQHGIAVGLDEADYRGEFLGTWSQRNVWGQRRPVRVPGEVVSTRQMVPKTELLRSEMYNEYLHPRGLHEGLRLAIRAGGGEVEDISLLRPWSAGPFAGREIALARTLLPHLQRGAAVARRLRLAEREAAIGFAALDTMSHAAFLLDGAGRVVRMNRAAEALTRAGDGLMLAPGGLATSHPAVAAALVRLVREAAGTVGPAACSGHLRLPRPSGRADLVAIAQPAGGRDGWGFADPGWALVLICDPEAEGAASSGQLQALYALTPAEAAVALDLLAGREVGEIARRRGRSVATIRTHLARLLAKTGMARQADLIRLLLRMPLSGQPPGASGPSGNTC